MSQQSSITALRCQLKSAKKKFLATRLDVWFDDISADPHKNLPQRIMLKDKRRKSAKAGETPIVAPICVFLTINVPLFKKLRDIVFFVGQ
jgi:hypothetical protein